MPWVELVFRANRPIFVRNQVLGIPLRFATGTSSGIRKNEIRAIRFMIYHIFYYLLPTTNYLVPTITYQLSPISYQLSPISYHLSPIPHYPFFNCSNAKQAAPNRAVSGLVMMWTGVVASQSVKRPFALKARIKCSASIQSIRRGGIPPPR